MNPPRWGAIFLAAATTMLPVLAAAEADDADILFREGRSLMKKGDYRAACRRFSRSRELDPAAGTSINLGDCLAQLGKLADALSAYQEARRLLSPDDPRVDPLDAQIRGIAPRVPRLVLRAGGRLPEGAEVKCDGLVVEHSALGTELPLNVGKHVVIVAIPGSTETRYEVELGERDWRELTIGSVSGKRRSTQNADAEMPAKRADVSEQGSSNTIGYVLTAIAAAGAVGFVGFGLAGNSKKSTLEACKPDCPDRSIYDNMKQDYLLANVSAGIAIVAGAIAVFTFAQAPDQPGVQATRGIKVGGRW